MSFFLDATQAIRGLIPAIKTRFNKLVGPSARSSFSRKCYHTLSTMQFEMDTVRPLPSTSYHTTNVSQNQSERPSSTTSEATDSKVIVIDLEDYHEDAVTPSVASGSRATIIDLQDYGEDNTSLFSSSTASSSRTVIIDLQDHEKDGMIPENPSVWDWSETPCSEACNNFRPYGKRVQHDNFSEDSSEREPDINFVGHLTNLFKRNLLMKHSLYPDWQMPLQTESERARHLNVW